MTLFQIFQKALTDTFSHPYSVKAKPGISHFVIKKEGAKRHLLIEVFTYGEGLRAEAGVTAENRLAGFSYPLSRPLFTEEDCYRVAAQLKKSLIIS